MWQTKVTQLTPLKGMQLKYLNIASTPIIDLSPLKGMQLNHVTLNHTPITDLSPLRGMPLQFLLMQGSNVSDLSPLDGMDLTDLAFTPGAVTKGIEVIRRMKSLKNIGGDGHGDRIPAAEFWKKYDAGVFGKP